MQRLLYFINMSLSSRRCSNRLLTDVLSLPTQCAPPDFAGGRAHQGISQSAVSVWNRAKDQVESLLREHDDYQLVLTGTGVVRNALDFPWALFVGERGRPN